MTDFRFICVRFRLFILRLEDFVRNGAPYISVLHNYLEYSLDDNHTVNLSFQSTGMHVFHAAVSIKCCVTFRDEQEVKVKS